MIDEQPQCSKLNTNPYRRVIFSPHWQGAVSKLSDQHTAYVSPTLQSLWAWEVLSSCLHHISCVVLELVTCAGSGCVFCTFSGSSYTVHPAPPLGVTRIHSLPFISCLPNSSTQCVLASWAPQRAPTSICHSCSIHLQSPAFGPSWCLTPNHCHSFLIPTSLPISSTIRLFFSS